MQSTMHLASCMTCGSVTKERVHLLRQHAGIYRTLDVNGYCMMCVFGLHCHARFCTVLRLFAFGSRLHAKNNGTFMSRSHCKHCSEIGVIGFEAILHGMHHHHRALA